MSRIVYDLEIGLRGQLDEDASAGVLRAVDAEQERERRCDIDRPDAGNGSLLANAGARRDERRMHVHACRQVDEVRQVAVLAEELAEGDALAGRGRVELVGRPEDDGDVAASAGMERIGAVDVSQLALEEHVEDDLLAWVSGVCQVLEGRDDLVPDRVEARQARHNPAGIAPREVDVDLRGAAGPAGLCPSRGSRRCGSC